MKRLPLGVRRALRVGLWLAVAAAVVLFARSLDLPALALVLRHTLWPLVAVVVALCLLGASLRGVYWWLALAALGTRAFRQAQWLAFVAIAGNFLGPTFAGEAFRVWQLKRLFGVPMASSMGIAALEKAADALALALALAPLLWLQPALPFHARELLIAFPALVAALMAILWLARNRFSRAVQQWLGGLQLLRSPGRASLGFAALLMVRLLDGAQIALLLLAVGLRPAPDVVLLVMLFVNVAVAIPVSPGNIGTHELGSIAALVLVGIPSDQAAAFAVLYHATQTVPLIAAALPNLRAVLSRPTLPPEPNAAQQ